MREFNRFNRVLCLVGVCGAFVLCGSTVSKAESAPVNETDVLPEQDLSKSSAPTPSSVSAPCVEGKPAPGEFGVRPCSVVIPLAIENMEKRVRNQVDGYYHGMDCDFSIPHTSEKAGECPGKPFGKETCNIIPGLFNNDQAEIESNHINKECGDWTNLEFEATVVKKMGIPVGVKTTVKPDQRGHFGRREEAYTRGALVAATNCYHAQVKKEVQDKKLRITEIAGKPGLCAPIARRVLTLINTAASTSKLLEKRLEGQANRPDIENCDEYAKTRSEEPITFENAKGLRQSACYLKAARADIEAVFKQLAACEVFARVRLSFVRFTDKYFSSDAQQARKKKFVNACLDKGSSSDVLNRCYQKEYLKHFKSQIMPKWGDTQSCN